jgi:hypothetical protein
MHPYPNERRWQRYPVDLPVRITGNGPFRLVVPGRGTELSEGGMALCVGSNLQLGDLIEIEFGTPSPARVTGIIRNRACYSFGLEFLIPLRA